MKSFPSIYEIRDATAEQIAMQADLPMSVAEEIYEFFITTKRKIAGNNDL